MIVSDETKEAVVVFMMMRIFFFISLVKSKMECVLVCLKERKNCDNYDTGGKNVVNKKCFAVVF